MNDKQISLAQAISMIDDGSSLAFGGNTLHRSPSVFAMVLALHKKKHLTIIKTAGAFEVDILCSLGCVKTVLAGFIGYENEYGLASFYRQAVEKGEVQVVEHACYTVITGLRAATYGLPFLPVAGLEGSELLSTQDFREIIDPYTYESFYAIPAIKPDWGIIHVQEADQEGNCRIQGSKFEDPLIARAANKLLITTEKIVPEKSFVDNPSLTDIPGFLVSGVIEIPKGASPGTCTPHYGIDHHFLKTFKGCQNQEDIINLIGEKGGKYCEI